MLCHNALSASEPLEDALGGDDVEDDLAAMRRFIRNKMFRFVKVVNIIDKCSRLGSHLLGQRAA